MILFTFLALVSAPFLAVCSASPLEERAEDTFNIYAFGEGISGLQLYSEDGVARIGDPTQPSGMKLSTVSFTVSSSAEFTWIAHTNSSAAKGVEETLSMRTEGPSEVNIGASNGTSSALSNVWWLYGDYVMTNVAEAKFYVEPISGTPGWFSLFWTTGDSVGDKGGEAITLRTTKPSTFAVLGKPSR